MGGEIERLHQNGKTIFKTKTKHNTKKIFLLQFLLLFGRDRLSSIWNESKDKLRLALSPPASPGHSNDDDSNEACDPPPTKRACTSRTHAVNYDSDSD